MEKSYAFFKNKKRKKHPMGIGKNNILAFSLVGVLLSLFVLPVYGEVETFWTDKLSYVKGDTITFSGTVDDETMGLVTIVIRDSNDEFVLLTQAMINPDNTFERSVESNNKFTVHGIYNSTAFIVNMTEGSLIRFDFSLDGSPVIPSVNTKQNSQPTQVNVPQTITTTTTPESEPQVELTSEPEPDSKIASFVDPDKDPQYYIDRYNNESAYREWFDRNYPDITIEEAVGLDEKLKDSQGAHIPGFPDPDKDPQYYIDRYNNESAYREWFDRNFPEQTIYDVVGISIEEINDTEETNIEETNSTATEIQKTTQESLPTQVESSTVSPSVDGGNNELGQMLLALGGLGVLFGAVYGIKRKVDTNTEQITETKTKVNENTEQISQNRFWLKKKIMNLKPGAEPVQVIKDRLAKGEITVDEYYKLLRALKK